MQLQAFLQNFDLKKDSNAEKNKIAIRKGQEKDATFIVGVRLANRASLYW